jgi:hypothetical protein
MGKTNQQTETTTNETAAAAPAAAAAAPSEEVTLEEFCIRLSKSDKRVEMIGGFNASETAAGHVKDTEASFRARYDQFCNKPA